MLSFLHLYKLDSPLLNLMRFKLHTHSFYLPQQFYLVVLVGTRHLMVP